MSQGSFRHSLAAPHTLPLPPEPWVRARWPERKHLFCTRKWLWVRGHTRGVTGMRGAGGQQVPVISEEQSCLLPGWPAEGSVGGRISLFVCGPRYFESLRLTLDSICGKW